MNHEKRFRIRKVCSSFKLMNIPVFCNYTFIVRFGELLDLRCGHTRILLLKNPAINSMIKKPAMFKPRLPVTNVGRTKIKRHK